jgi:ectoine hydroxylase-related dioxygenase (phytanoyl-CoA dioxygenase family)
MDVLFEKQGFVEVGPLVGEEECACLREACDQILEEDMGTRVGELTASMFLPSDQNVLTILSPEARVPSIWNLSFVKPTWQLAEQIARKKMRMGWRFFVKVPGFGMTRWHQDAAYRPEPHTSMSLWIPLEETGTSGMMYLPGTHQEAGLRPHCLEHHHRYVPEVDARAAVICDTKRGWGIAHHCKILHAAGPANAVRRALVLVFSPTGV